MNEPTVINVDEYDPAQIEVDRLWNKITELFRSQQSHEHELKIVMDQNDSLHRENQALRRELSGRQQVISGRN
jgi:hypothetical protein